MSTSPSPAPESAKNEQVPQEGQQQQLKQRHLVSTATSTDELSSALIAPSEEEVACMDGADLAAFEATESPSPYVAPSALSVVLLALFALPMFLTNVALLMQPTDDGMRQMMRMFDAKLGVPLKEEDYAMDCSDIAGKLFDPFAIGHFAGWLVSTLVTRDWKLTAVLFTLDEVLELWWREAHGNFRECWWDSLILDMAVCNTIGALIGHWLVPRWRGSGTRRWFYRGCLSEWRWWAFIIDLVAFRLVMFFCVFGFKGVLWIPSSHFINFYRPLAYLAALEPTLVELYGNLRRPTQGSARLHGAMWLFTLADAAVCLRLGYHTPIWETTGPLLRTLSLAFGALAVTSAAVWQIYFSCGINRRPARLVRSAIDEYVRTGEKKDL